MESPKSSILQARYLELAQRREGGVVQRPRWKHVEHHAVLRRQDSPHEPRSGEDVKVVQELLRHSTARMTLDTYTQAYHGKAVGIDALLRCRIW